MTLISPVQELTDFHYEIAHEMFVPTGQIVTPHELGSFVLGTYAEARIQRHEDLDSLLLADAYRFLPKSEEELIAIADRYGIGSLADQTLDLVNRETDDQIYNAIRRIRHLPVNKHLVASSDVLAQDAHEGKFRKTGKPYFSHVFRVAAMGFYVASALEAEGLRDDPERTIAEVIIREHHDAPEETMPAGKHFDPNREGHFSPLLILRLMERFDNPYARATADGLRFITHLNNKNAPWMRTYPDYVFQRVMQNFEANDAKQDDIFDNRHNEPKPVNSQDERERRQKKHDDYDMLTPMLRARSIELAPTHECISWISRGIEIRRDIVPGPQEEMVDRLEEFIYADAA